MPNNQKVTYTLDIQAQVNNALSELNKLDKVFDELNTESKIPVELTGNSKNLISDLKKLGESFKTLSEEGVSSTKDMDKINSAFEKFEKLIRRLKSQESNLEKYNFSKLIPKDTIQQINSLQKALAPLLKKQTNFNQKSIGNESLLSQRKVELADAQSSLKISQERREELEKEKEAIGNLITERQRLNKVISEATTKEEKDKHKAELKEKVPLTIKELNTQKTTINGQIKEYDVAYKKIQNLEEEIRKLESNTIELNFSDAELATLDRVKKELKDTFGVEVEGNVEDVSHAIDGLTDKLAQPYESAISNAVTQTKSLENAAETLGKKLAQDSDEVEKLANKATQLDEFKNRALNFFSIANGVTLFQRALRSAYKTVTDLDKVMTETAVVTDFTVGDMWEQLPEYTKRANELGVTTKSAYESATLYYQQGLNTNEVMQLTNATLKMARIASLDAAEATDRMTNALRGFNMELNETNANRVADVYSKLAAITASDVDEISTAMTKTASIASSAGMQFETTAAFLSQIIETTRESAETAGTALKTVIARFEELKKSPSEIGEVDGEIVDANKVEGALRSVGISLRDAEGQFRNLDEVFLELAKEWKNLDKNTQRYIATIAAGSRQQSRFIAMMQNYEHTVELVDAAYNAAGASQEQYEKTLESLESKINKLYNAWNEFTMSLANSTVIKGAVDLLTGFLNVINFTTDAFGNLGGAVAKALIGISAFKIGRKLFKGEGVEMATSFIQGFSTIKDSKSLQKSFKGLFNTIKTSDLININDLGLSSQHLKLPLEIDPDTSQVKQTIGSYLDQFDGKISIQQGEVVKKALKDAGVEIEALDQQVGQLSKKYDVLSASAMAAGMAIYGIGQILKSNGVSEEWVETVESAGTALMGVAAALQLIKSLSGVEGIIGAFVSAHSTAIIGVVAALGALYVGFKAIDAIVESGEEKLERLKQETDNVKEAANKAKDAYDNLLSDTEKYDNLTKSLSELTYGTNEWTNALLNTNKQALDLINTYENLKYTIGQHGEIVIDSDSLEKAQKDALERTQKFNAQVTLSNLRLNNETSAQEKTNALNEMYKMLSRIYSDTDSEISDFIQGKTDLANDPRILSDDRERLLKLRETYLSTGIDAVETGATLKNSLLMQLSDKDRAKEGILDIADIVSESLTETYGEEINKQESNIKAETNDTLSEIRKKYKGMFLASDDEIKDLDKKTMISRMANQTYLEQAEDTLKKAFEASSKMGSYQQRLLEIYAQGSDAITASDIQLFGEGFEPLISSIITQVGDFLPKDFKEGMEDIKNSLNPDIFANYVGTFLENASRGQIERFENQQTLIKARNGDSEGFIEYIKEILEDISEEEKEQFLKIFSAYDFSNYEDVEAFVSQIKELGFAFNKGRTIREYTDEINNLTNSLSNKNLASMQTTAKTLIELVNSLSGADLSRVFSEEEVQQMTATQEFNEGDFQYTGTGFVYIGNSIEKLQEILLNAALSGLERTIESAETKIANGKRVEELIENSKIGNPDLDWDALIDKYSNGKLQDDRDNKKYYDALGVDTFVEFTNLLDNYLKLEENRADYNANITKVEQSRVISDNDNVLDASNLNIEEQKEALQGKINLNKAEATYAKTLNNAEKEVKNYNNLLMFHSVNLKKVSDKYEILTKDITDNTDALKNADINDSQYWEALTKLGDDLNSIFETDFFNETNIQDIIGEELPNLLAGGDSQIKAIERIGRKAGESYINGLKEQLDHEQDGIIDNLVNQLDNIKADVNIKGTFDASQIVKTLLTLFKDDIPKVRDALNALSAFGLTISINDTGLYDVKYIDDNGESQLVKVAEKDLESFKKLKGFSATRRIETVATKNEDIPDLTIPSGSGSQSEPEWKNPYDWLYNITEQINQNLSERERLEKRYNILVARNTAQIKDANTFYKEQLDSLYEEYELQKQIQKGRKNTAEHDLLALQEYGRANKLDQYVNWDEEHLTVRINWDAIEEVDRRNDEELGEKIEDLVSKYETVWKQIDEVEKELLNIEYSIHNLNQESVDKYIDFENRVIQAIENIRQQEIDNTSKLYDSINEANTTLTNAVQKNIDKIRQDRQNAETEEEINKKERRLAYLRQDTSTANQSEILKLEQELQGMKTDYEDTLVDQSLQDMQDQNEAAAEQREREIAIMTAQLEWDKEHGVLAKQAYEMIVKASQDGYFLSKDSELYDIITRGEGWLGSSAAKQYVELQKLNTQLSEAVVPILNNLVYKEDKDWSKVWLAAYKRFINATSESEKQQAANEMYDAEAKRNYKIASTNSNYVQTDNLTGRVVRGEKPDLDIFNKTEQIEEPNKRPLLPEVKEPTESKSEKAIEETNPQNKTIEEGKSKISGLQITNNKEYEQWSADEATKLQEALNDYFLKPLGKPELLEDGIIGNKTRSAVASLQDTIGAHVDYRFGEETRKKWKEALENEIIKFKTGGLVDTTGLAWLDGTKANPEIVLNAQDSANLIQLRDMLRQNSMGNGKLGDNFFDININVDKLTSDYDVEQVARAVEQLIITDATYRNVNAVSTLRK